ncbi:MAG: hypothetical protein QW802_00465 [Candidatus Altiarchaeota archaeon]
MKIKEIVLIARIIFAILVILLIISQIRAQFTWQSDDSIIPFARNSEALMRKLNEIAQSYREKYPEFFYELSRRAELIHKISRAMDNLMQKYTEILIPFTMAVPDVSHSKIKTLLSTSISILEPLYIIAILLTAIYLLFLSASPRGRTNAKATLVRLIIGLGIIMLTLPIIQLLLEISHSFASIVIAIFQPNTEIFKFSIEFFMAYFAIVTFFKPIPGSFFLLLSILLPILVLIILSVRYLAIILITAIFPFAVFLYSFAPLSRSGKIIISVSLMWIFLPIFNAFIIGAASVSFYSVNFIPLKLFISLAGYLLLIISPLIFIKILDLLLGSAIVITIKQKISFEIDKFILE